MAKFKEEFENCIVTVNSRAIGKIQINTSEVNPNHWANIKEFAFMFEEEKETPKEENIDDFAENCWEELSLKQLRERFPNIKATSKKEFIEQIEE